MRIESSAGYFSPATPRIIAHRGLSVDAPENTLLSFLKALSAGVRHLETDVHASADGHAVISHDEDLARVAGRSVRVDQLTMAELRKVNLGAGQSFSSLAEMLDAFPDARVNIDVKSAAAIEPTVRAILDAHATDRVLVTSFDEKRRAAAVAGLPGVATSASSSILARTLVALRTGNTSAVARALGGVGAVQVPERYGPVRIVTPRSVRMLRNAGVEVHVWTINDPADMRRLLDMGVDGLVTDRADLALALVAERNGFRE
ncbi:glycerophosphodiester phosphodiesterase [Homoserinimonas hongtaonis]|uniref:glycerophosphodiester phosphodiesterase n=1 Tax=Homoserinimonas hongtaonis TaxID=2079791 RepID=UPI001F5434F1|nr:glycerophosphodiester phosphodiesterase [Salinibacterium hongtaonis]